MSQTATSFSLSQIGQIAVTVQDMDRAVKFYRDTLGMRMLFQMPSMAFFDCAGVRLMLTLPEKARPNEVFSSILYYKVADIQAACDTLTARGVAFFQPARLIAKMPDHDLWMAAFRDPEDNVLELMSEVRPA
jgi:predicted enzyme related to lactoylglutathione lyase